MGNSNSNSSSYSSSNSSSNSISNSNFNSFFVNENDVELVELHNQTVNKKIKDNYFCIQDTYYNNHYNIININYIKCITLKFGHFYNDEFIKQKLFNDKLTLIGITSENLNNLENYQPNNLYLLIEYFNSSCIFIRYDNNNFRDLLDLIYKIYPAYNFGTYEYILRGHIMNHPIREYNQEYQYRNEFQDQYQANEQNQEQNQEKIKELEDKINNLSEKINEIHGMVSGIFMKPNWDLNVIQQQEKN